MKDQRLFRERYPNFPLYFSIVVAVFVLVKEALSYMLR
jgi:hypothetical protein